MACRKWHRCDSDMRTRWVWPLCRGRKWKSGHEAVLVAQTDSPNDPSMPSPKHCLSAIWLLLLLPASAFGSQLLPPSIASRIDEVFAPFDHDGSPGYALGVVKDGQLIFSRGYGRANIDYNVSITSGTSFHLASLSKQFTAAAIALLILDGKLTLETPVATYFPEVARYHADLRIKHLIYFTSGLPEYTSLPRLNGRPGSPITISPQTKLSPRPYALRRLILFRERNGNIRTSTL